jgi:hypothetical protein
MVFSSINVRRDVDERLRSRIILLPRLSRVIAFVYLYVDIDPYVFHPLRKLREDTSVIDLIREYRSLSRFIISHNSKKQHLTT